MKLKLFCFLLVFPLMSQAQTFLETTLFQSKEFRGESYESFQVPSLGLSQVFNASEFTQLELKALYRFEEEEGFYTSGLIYLGPRIGNETTNASIRVGSGLEYDTWSGFVDMPLAFKGQVNIPFVTLEAGVYKRLLEGFYFDNSELVYFITAKVNLYDIAGITTARQISRTNALY